MRTSLMRTCLLSILFITACSKTKYPRVEYKVSSSSSYVFYSMLSGTISQEKVSGTWSKSFNHTQGGTVLLQATHAGIGTTSISVYSNSILLVTKSTSLPGETIQIYETLP